MRFKISEVTKENTLESADVNAVEYEKVLEEIGFGKTQVISGLICGLITITTIAVQTVVGFIAIASQCEFAMSQSQKGIMMVACVTGIFLSTYIWGYLSDILGRRVVLLYGTLAACSLMFISIFVTNIWLFNIINLLVGISLGGGSAAMYPYLSEFNTAKYRVIVINYSTMFVSIATIYVPATAWLVLSYDWSLDLVFGITLRPWRLLIILNLLPGLIGALWLIQFPESPKLLLAQDKQLLALSAVEWICKYNKGQSIKDAINRTDLKMRSEKISDDDVDLTKHKGCDFLLHIWKVTVPLFHRPHCRNFLISAAAVFLMFFGAKMWYPEIVNRASAHPANIPATICEILDESFAKQTHNTTEATSTICIDENISTKTYIDNMIVGFTFLVGFIIQGLLLNPLGRKNVILGALSIGTLSVILLQFVTNSTAILILFCLYILMPGLSTSVMLSAVVDLLPTSMRGKAVSICLTLGRLSLIIVANLIGLTLEPMCIGTFGILTITLFVCWMLVYILHI